MTSAHLFAAVILDTAIDRPLDYTIPEKLAQVLTPGSRVEVPVKGKLQTGYVLQIKDNSLYSPLKPIHEYLGIEQSIPTDLFQLALWVSRYYCSSLRDVFRMLLPPPVRKGMVPKTQQFVKKLKTQEELREACIGLREKHPAQVAFLEALLPVKKGMLLTELLEKAQVSRSVATSLEKKGFISLGDMVIDRSPLKDEEYFITPPKKLNEDQASALEKIKNSLSKSLFETHLLYGVTGSGKTEVYLQAISYAIERGKGALLLVPEISLTAQTIQRFKSRFQEKIAILHHRLSAGERNDEWHNIRTGKAKIVIGARSAIFSPVNHLGLIIVDEEHESSYKQNERSPCYHARDVAVMRAKLSQSTIILGSATPSLESYYNAQQKKYTLSILHHRAETSSLPTVKIVDMRKEYEKAKGKTNFSDLLLNQMEKRLKASEQTILFLNRRGYYTLLLCPSCGKSVKCRHCEVSLTFHKNEEKVTCHLCGYETPPPKNCLNCGNGHPLKFRGAGTEQIEKALHAIFPSIKTLRIDADTTKHKGSHEKLLREFGSGKADVLIGTQMIAKGLHFPEVTLVGILNSDIGLNTPDFRASETVFQLITQVAGRAGRGHLPGEVILQTTVPDNNTIRYAAQQDFESFFREEIEIRKLFGYPPFYQLAKVTISGKNASQTEMYARKLRQAFLQVMPHTFEFQPVLPSGHSKIKDLYRFQFLFKGPSLYLVNDISEKIKKTHPFPHDIRWFIDINPLSTFF